MSILFTDFVKNIIKKSKMNVNDVLLICNEYDPHKPVIDCRVTMNYCIPNGKTTILRFRYDKSTHYLVDYMFEEVSSSFSELENYLMNVKDEPIPITDDLNTLVPAKLSQFKYPDSVIMLSVDPCSASGLKICLSDRRGRHEHPVPPPLPFDQLIHTKPITQAEVCKWLARRLVRDGFRIIRQDYLICNYPVTRMYVYRNIHIAFYQDVMMFVGIVYPPNYNKQTVWKEFRDLRPDILDTDVFDFLSSQWYDLNNPPPTHDFRMFIRCYPDYEPPHYCKPVAPGPYPGPFPGPHHCHMPHFPPPGGEFD